MPCRTRNVCLRLGAEGGTPGSFPPDPKCSGTMRREMDEADLYTEVRVCGQWGWRREEGGC